jgi:predicted AAA+ superfamily ATPase
MKWVARRQSAELDRLLKGFPAVLIVGPRQCGKSSLAKSAKPDWRYLDLERPSDRERLMTAPEEFLERYGDRLIVDEAQTVPELFPILRVALDRGGRKGRMILLGSAGLALMRGVSESLAGRVGIMELTPFRAPELVGRRAAKDRWMWGGFPPVHAAKAHDTRLDWYESYVRTFVERDLPALGWRVAPERLRLLLGMLAHVHGNLLNVSDLARSLSISQATVDNQIDLLEGGFLVRRLRPHFANLQKRLVKSPKLYIRDTGLLHYLAGVRTADDLAQWPRRGASFEGMIVEELIALMHDRVRRPYASFWRTSAGAEVDLLLGDGTQLLPIEIKLGRGVDQYAVAGLRNCMSDLGLDRGWVVTGSGERQELGRGIELVPWPALVSGEVELPF